MTKFSYTEPDGMSIMHESHTLKWYRVLWYWVTWPYRFFFPPKLTELNLCSLDELMSGKFVDQNGGSISTLVDSKPHKR